MRGTSFTPSCLAAAHLCTVAAPHCTGAILMAIAWPVNLGALGNSLAIWLGISPWQLFFYVFLPPLLLDAAVRIDWYLFKKVGMGMGCRGKQLGSVAVHIPKAAFLSRHPSPSIGGSTAGGPGGGVGGGGQIFRVQQLGHRVCASNAAGRGMALQRVCQAVWWPLMGACPDGVTGYWTACYSTPRVACTVIMSCIWRGRRTSTRWCKCPIRNS